MRRALWTTLALVITIPNAALLPYWAATAIRTQDATRIVPEKRVPVAVEEAAAVSTPEPAPAPSDTCARIDAQRRCIEWTVEQTASCWRYRLALPGRPGVRGPIVQQGCVEEDRAWKQLQKERAKQSRRPVASVSPVPGPSRSSEPGRESSRDAEGGVRPSLSPWCRSGERREPGRAVRLCRLRPREKFPEEDK